MENIAFVLWMVLYPVATSICNYIATKERKINNLEPFSEGVRAVANLVYLVVYIVIAKILYN